MKRPNYLRHPPLSLKKTPLYQQSHLGGEFSHFRNEPAVIKLIAWIMLLVERVIIACIRTVGHLSIFGVALLITKGNPAVALKMLTDWMLK